MALHPWVMTTDEIFGGQPPRIDLLTEEERRRAATFHRPADRLDYLAAHLLVRTAVADLLGCEAADVQVSQTCRECGERGHGPPSIHAQQPVYASWSHTRSRVAAVAAHCLVGIDIERPVRAQVAWEAAAGALSAAERAEVNAAADPGRSFLSLWTCKEALVKAGAISLSDFQGVDLSGRPGRWEGWDLLNFFDEEHDCVVGLATVSDIVTPPGPPVGQQP